MSTNLDIILYLLIFTCLVFSALLSGSETAITSLPREKIHQLDDSKKNKRIKRAKDKKKAQQEEHAKIKAYGESINEETRNKNK